MQKIKVMLLVVMLLVIFQDNYAQVFGSFSGKVVDEETGKGIEGVRVLLYKGISIWTERSTNKEGDFIIEKLLPGTYGLEFCPPKPYAWDWWNQFKFNQNSSVYEGMQAVVLEKWKNTYIIKKCKKGGTIQIKAIEKNSNTPVPNVYIHFKQGVNLGLMWGNKKSMTNSNGVFELEQLADAKCDIYLKRTGYWDKHITDFYVHYNQISELNVNYDKENLTKISGCITCQNSGKPVVNITVLIQSLDDNDWSICITDSNGNFSMNDMVPGNYEIIIKKSAAIGTENLSKKVTLNKDQSMNIPFILDCI
jgi:hypothetical protein